MQQEFSHEGHSPFPPLATLFNSLSPSMNIYVNTDEYFLPKYSSSFPDNRIMNYLYSINFKQILLEACVLYNRKPVRGKLVNYAVIF